MSQDQYPLAAGVDPTERSGVGAAPAIAPLDDPPNVPVSPIPPDEDFPVDDLLTPDADSSAGEPSTDEPSTGESSTSEASTSEHPGASELIDLDLQSAPPIDPSRDLGPSGVSPPRLSGRGPGSPRRLVLPQQAAASTRQLSADQKLLILDTWQRSGLPASDFGAIVGLSKQTLYAWKKRFEKLGPAGLDDQARKKLPTGSKIPEITRRTILMLKQSHPDWGCGRISDVLYRGPGLPASANTVARVLKEAGYVTEELPTKPHPDRVRSFERAVPNQLWQTDLFTFLLKRQNRRLYLVAFMDDHSRYVVGYGLHASQSAALVLEVFRAAIASCGSPQEVLTDNGAQYVTWRGTSAFARELRKRGIKHVVASPHRPQTLGKVERFWGTLWRECLASAVFLDLEDARRRIGHFIDYYNFQRPHQSLEGLSPADRFFGAARETLATLKARVQANALELARGGLPRNPFYLTGQVGGKPFSVHAEGERVFMVAQDGQRQEIDLVAPTPASPPASPQMPTPLCAQGVVTTELADETEPAPGTSPLDDGLKNLAAELNHAPDQAEGDPS
jgi:transposase InsO family protein